MNEQLDAPHNDSGVKSRRTDNTKLYGLSFDERQLQMLVERVRAFVTELGLGDGNVRVHIHSGRDTFELRGELELLKVPRAVDQIWLFAGRSWDELSCLIRLDPDYALVQVESNGGGTVRARALLTELESELRRRAYEFSWVARWVGPLKRQFLANVITTLLLDTALFLFALKWGKLSIFAAGSWAIAIIVFLFLNVLKKAFPGVRFEGHFLDQSKRWRKVLYFVAISVFLLPVVGRLVQLLVFRR